MNEIILHHYEGSPYAEKIRLLLGARALAWRSVEVSNMLPRPELAALTGGYRRIPVLQIGAQVYCDTALIATVLDAIGEAPALSRPEEPLDAVLADLAERELFGAAVGYVFQPRGFAALFKGMSKAQIEAFMADRRSMRAGSAPRMELPEASALLDRWLRRVSALLADGRPWLLGTRMGIADLAVYHPLWFVARAPALASVLEAHAGLRDWMARVAALGHGRGEPMQAAQALAAARAASPAEPQALPWVDWHGCQPGDDVIIEPTDYGIVPVRGLLAVSAPDRLALRRRHDDVGEVLVHFPRNGYRLRRP
jgi:glutathione S-transferase